MVKKVQVTLEDEQYRKLVQLAQREGRKLATVVRQSVEKYCLEPEALRRKREALEDLLQLPPTPVPADYSEWKRTYGAIKTKSKTKKNGS
jgi:predicted DNA-binding protein